MRSRERMRRRSKEMSKRRILRRRNMIKKGKGQGKKIHNETKEREKCK